jgi:tetratricopeptide (TPR) repeat protein
VDSSFNNEDVALEALSARFLEALDHKDKGRVDDAEDALRAILREEPRLAEPRMELARLLLDTERLDAAESEAREALEQLEATGPWLEEPEAEIVEAIAHALLAEILRRRADDDNVIFGDPAAFKALVQEARSHFEQAAALDPSNDYSSYYAFFLGVGQSPVPPLPDPLPEEAGDDEPDA